jgi:hypothetical protein
MEIICCPNCSTRVLLKADGTCPSCLAAVDTSRLEKSPVWPSPTSSDAKPDKQSKRPIYQNLGDGNQSDIGCAVFLVCCFIGVPALGYALGYGHGDTVDLLALRLVWCSLPLFFGAAYALVAMWTVRRVRLSGPALLWVVTAFSLSGAFILVEGDRFPPSLSGLRNLVALVPVFTTAAISILIWRLHKRTPVASALRCVAHGMAGLGLGVGAVLLAACCVDIASWLRIFL